MSKTGYKRHGFTIFLLSGCLMVMVFMGITLSTVLDGSYVKRVLTNDNNVALIRNYTNQKLGSLVNSYSPINNLSATTLSKSEVKKIINTSVDELYDGNPKLNTGDAILGTIGDNLKSESKAQGLNIGPEIDETLSSNKGIMDQIVNDNIGPINSALQNIKQIRGIVKTIILVAAILFILLAFRLRLKVGSNMLFLHHIGTVGICASILLAIVLVFIYYPVATYITSNVEYGVKDVLYNILNGIFTNYISILIMMFVLSIIDWGSTGKYKYN
ncbi:hypothetical protein [Companilactobacillus mishanensis]|uniref:hypothetical protein n=1 Tax=Companilactobacillus mishanensis TaxID=2486008 RepID=UPI001295E668|nr:hypothetical protein [Companilactobacillus mishanensis]MQS89181.1 hypothetical protein [Companilactobacillus mishanensis]